VRKTAGDFSVLVGKMWIEFAIIYAVHVTRTVRILLLLLQRIIYEKNYSRARVCAVENRIVSYVYARLESGSYTDRSFIYR